MQGKSWATVRREGERFANIAPLIILRHPLMRQPRIAKNREVAMAARLRHIALSVSDPDKAAKFFEDAFGMKRVGKAGIGCYVSDGTVNVALLKYDGDVPGFQKGYHGLVHFGMWVDNLDEAAKQATDAGATHFAGEPEDNPHAFYEVKYKSPDGVIFDLTHNGWRGAVKEVVPAEAEKVPAE
jgi:lactoylglutathione lyase